MILWLAHLTDAERWAVGLLALLVIGGTAQWLNHSWANRRNTIERDRDASADFRAAIHLAIATVPTAAKHWGNDTVAAIPRVCQDIGSAVALLAPHLGSNRRSFEAEWSILKHHCERTIPNALSAANILYYASSGGPNPARAKEKFHTHVTNLLTFAKDA